MVLLEAYFANHAHFIPAITRTWNTWSRTESACVESTNVITTGAPVAADRRRVRLQGNVYRSSITDVKRRYTKHCNVNKMADSSGLGPSKFITYEAVLEKTLFYFWVKYAALLTGAFV